MLNQNKEYGVIYIKVCPTGNGEWVKYCHFLSETPKSFQQNVETIANDINKKYSEDIVIPMDIDVHPGCTTKPEKVDEIAQDMYNQFSELAEIQGIPNSIRCVYSIGELENVNKESTHHLIAYPVMIKIGRFLDESDEPGIYKI